MFDLSLCHSYNCKNTTTTFVYWIVSLVLLSTLIAEYCVCMYKKKKKKVTMCVCLVEIKESLLLLLLTFSYLNTTQKF